MSFNRDIQEEMVRLQGEHTQLTERLAAINAELEELVVASRVAARLDSRSKTAGAEGASEDGRERDANASET